MVRHMKTDRIRQIAVVVAMTAIAAGCTSTSPTAPASAAATTGATPDTSSPPPATATPVTSPTAPAPGGTLGPDAWKDPANFVAVIDNQWLPFKPGTVWRYEGTKDGKRARDITRSPAGPKSLPALPASSWTTSCG